MYRVATRNVAVFFPRCCSLAHYTPSLFPIFTSFAPSRFLRINGCVKNVSSYTDKKVSRGSSRATKKPKIPNNVLDDKDLPHILWWKERLQMCRKFSTVQLIERLDFSNLLGLDSNLKNGSLKEGTLNYEMLQFKSKFPRQVLLCRVGDFYEAWGIDACVLVEYAGLNPFGGLRSDSIPRAGCPVVNLRQTLDDLTQNGFSVCIVEEVQGPTQVRSRKRRFISGPLFFRPTDVDWAFDPDFGIFTYLFCKFFWSRWSKKQTLVTQWSKEGEHLSLTHTAEKNIMSAVSSHRTWG